MANGAKPAIDILSCDAFAWELGTLAKEINEDAARSYRVNCIYLTQRLHVDFNRLGEEVAAALGKLRGSKVALLYGSLCHPDFSFLPGGGIHRLKEINCIHAISGESTAGQPRSFFLTPSQLAKWRANFSFDRKGPEEKRDFKERFRKYCDSAVFLDTGAGAADEKELALFAEATGLAVQKKQIGLAPFRKTLFALLEATWRGAPP
ncbi:MAG: DUF1638 domain-containing protein [Acidaminococcales bacterium]|jgi:hypothetical protein|nr:DUF1638 domain-containing protein [Acidaminococcales bacterium]